MADGTLRYPDPVCLVGAGDLTRARLETARALAPVVVATDGAADALWAWGVTPDAVVGDMDSIRDREAWRARPSRFLEIAEQETTDFEKALIHVAAPYFVGVGLTGRRIDHTLAVFHAMLARPERRVILLGAEEAIALAPPNHVLRFAQEAGAVVSLFPLGEAHGTVSKGLEWPVEGLKLAPGRQVGTSNRAVGGEVTLGFDAPGVLVILEARYLADLVHAVIAR